MAATNISIDIEKHKKSGITEDLSNAIQEDTQLGSVITTPISIWDRLRQLNATIEGLAGFEARGITRVGPDERRNPSFADDVQVSILWFTSNATVNNVAIGTLGPILFDLGFLDCAMCATFGALLGSISTSYMSIWGPQSGNRTMVVLRYFMGYYPSKLACLLNIILMLGYSTIDAIIGGQMLSAISGGNMSIIVGVIIVMLVSWVVSVFGVGIFHHYERWAGIPQAAVFMVLIGCAGPYFNAELQSSPSTSITSARISFLSMCIYPPNSWSAAASDYFVYYPEATSKVKIFLLTLTGLWLSYTFVFLLGIGLGCGVTINQQWANANDISTGALVTAAYGPLNIFGKICAVIIALGVIANVIPATYSAALGCQVLGRYGQALPRWTWSCVMIIIQLVCALAGRDHLYTVFENFLPLMGYWVQYMVFLVLEEHLLFRRYIGFDWSKWQDRSHLPLGLAALFSFFCGIAGAIIGMDQEWYVGKLAKLAGDADIGLYIGSGFTLLVYPPLRWLELRLVGR